MNTQIGYPIFSSENKKLADRTTILAEPIPSIDLHERACYQLGKRMNVPMVFDADALNIIAKTRI
jgi:hypothetical protein